MKNNIKINKITILIIALVFSFALFGFNNTDSKDLTFKNGDKVALYESKQPKS